MMQLPNVARNGERLRTVEELIGEIEAYFREHGLEAAACRFDTGYKPYVLVRSREELPEAHRSFIRHNIATAKEMAYYVHFVTESAS